MTQQSTTKKPRTKRYLFVLAGLGLVSAWSIADYRSWVSLGEGGLPHNLQGWGTMNAVRVMTLNRDPLDTSSMDTLIGNSSDLSLLQDLPTREGKRPTIARHPIPHRQLDQLSNNAVKAQTRAVFNTLVNENTQLLSVEVSQYEKHNNAIWLAYPESGNQDTKNNGEIAHFHPSDGSIHVILSPSDAKIAVERGWGQFHPLAGHDFLPAPTYVLLYAPRNEAENEVAKTIVASAIQYAQ